MAARSLGTCSRSLPPQTPAPGHPPGSGRKRAGAPGAAGGGVTCTRAISLPGGPSPKSKDYQEGARPAFQQISLPVLCLDVLSRHATHSSLPGSSQQGWRASNGREKNAVIRALPRGEDHGDWQHRGAAKGICPSALLPGCGMERPTSQKKKDCLATFAAVHFVDTV